ncbi:MAG: SUMF1/EgtB/PvdO family nonheme iron enzyme [Gemmatimonadota bacterium]|jgi:formylglycine-generating enzyme required for sulfatase activity/dienelactone hydrolase
MRDDLIGRTVSHYRILELLGGGGMGVVYRAEDVRLKRPVALKFLPPSLTRNEEARARFVREAESASALDHPAICTIHDIDETEDGRLFIAMTLYTGQTLADRLKEGPLPVAAAVSIAARVAEALERAHENGIVHRDIKPANLMLTASGAVKVLDFGVAKLMGATSLTAEDELTGTVSYMSPEQVEGKAVDRRTDVWSLGVVLYEMLTGINPFDRDRPEAAAAAILAIEPDLPGTLQDGIPPAVDELVRLALRKDPAVRLPTASQFQERLEATRPETAAGPATRWSRKAVFGTLTVALLAVVASGVLALQNRRNSTREAARRSLPSVVALADSGRYVEAWARLQEIEKAVGPDTTVERLTGVVTDVINVETDPPGASVEVIRFPRLGAAFGAIDAGTTPVAHLRVPRGDYRVLISLDGYAPAERIASGTLLRKEASIFAGATEVELAVPLQPLDMAPTEMVFVPGGSYELVSHAAPRAEIAELDAYWIDRYEVTNEEYLRFIREGGYQHPEYWEAPFVDGGRMLRWEEGIRRLVDRSGLPGPRDWVGQQYPEGAADHPVTGITWYEAAAFARYADKRLPTLHQWEKAARNGRIAHSEGVIMPWGYEGPGEGVEGRAAFGTTGTTPVDRYPFGISPFGVYAMAGNVREWTASAATGGHIATGGSWRDPAYLFNAIGVYGDTFAANDLGFRCVRPVAAAANRAGDLALDLDRRTPVYEPVDSATFQTLLTHYRYDRTTPDARIDERIETPDWTRERISWSEAGGDRGLGYLFLPRSAGPPWQTLVYIPGLSAFFAETPARATEWALGPIIRTGRAVFTPVLRGMVGRPSGSGFTPPEPATVAFRDLMVEHATEMRRGIDYLETRDDIDMERLAYVGLSFGAGSRLVFAGADDRFGAVVFMGGGIDERLMPTLPEASNVNFAPYIRPPKLLLNGTTDDEHPWLTRGLPLWNLLREPKHLELVEGAGHVPPVEARVPAITQFLDEVLGPVR